MVYYLRNWISPGSWVVLYEEGIPPVGLYNVSGLSQCNPQVEWIRGVNMDRVVRLESMDRDLDEVLVLLGIGCKQIGHLNAVERSEAKSDYLTSDNIRLIEHIYAEDFSTFGYKKRTDG